MLADSFRQAAETGDHDEMMAALAPDIVFRSPIVFKPYEGRDAVAPILAAVFTVFEDFRYVDQLEGEAPRRCCSRRRSATESSTASTTCASAKTASSAS